MPSHLSTPGTYISNIAKQAIIRSDEREVIQRSLDTLIERIFQEFDDSKVSGVHVFGSFSRETMLPSAMDPQSDVDVMVIFSDRGKKPQAYLDRLKRFAEHRYQRSEIAQDHPTIFLELKHMRFELVPAIDTGIWDGLQIPAKGTWTIWQRTDPNDISKALENRNKASNGLITPLIRLVKYWNALNKYPFESFELEKKVISHSFFLVPKNLESYFFDFMRELDAGYWPPAWKGERIQLLQKSLSNILKSKSNGDNRAAIQHLENLLPLPFE